MYVDKKDTCSVVLLDLNVFDMVNDDILLDKLNNLAIHGIVLKFKWYPERLSCN